MSKKDFRELVDILTIPALVILTFLWSQLLMNSLGPVLGGAANWQGPSFT